MGQQRTVFIATDAAHAQRFRQRLAEYGIVSQLQGRSEVSNDDARQSPVANSPGVTVDEMDYEFAYEIAADFDLPDPSQLAVGDGDAVDSEHDSDWPLCPGCRRRRVSVCPSCGNRDSKLEFAEWVAEPEVDSQATEQAWHDRDGSYALLLCSVCDTPFLAQFERRCQHCRHDFRNGVRPDRPRDPTELFSPRNVLIAGLLLLLAISLWVFLLRADPER